MSAVASAPAAAADRAPDWVAGGTPEPLRGDLVALLGEEQVLARAIDLVRYASDASPYRIVPQVVVLARSVADVVAVFRYARKHAVGVTMRAGGTSLNGQGQGAGILLDVRRHWRGAEALDGGAAARVAPGTTLGFANRVLRRHGTRLGPDPASTDIATAGGVIANNSGGMRCGVTQDSYSTLQSLTFVTARGTTINTAAPDAAERFAREEPELAAGLATLRDELRAHTELAARVRRKFAIKNTTGYRLCALLDADEPVEIFRRLLVGSEGTLGFVAEAVFDTVPVRPHTAVALLHFASMDGAAAVVPDMVARGATAVEVMVAPTLMVAAHNFAGSPEYWKELPFESAVLLVEWRSDVDGEADAAAADAMTAIPAEDLIRPAEHTLDEELIELYWTVREGMQGLVGRLRPPGTAFIIEDVCVPPERIAEAAKDLQALLGEHGFLPGVAGHASAGNLHFMLTPEFGKAEDRERYEAFMEQLVELVIGKYDGSLKAEHGTGRNMAPWVEREWGETATEMMWRIKALADPDGVLGPGVVLNRDPNVHLSDLKTTPEIEEIATQCIECGFCEPVCPSRDVTMTPRQRILIRRELARQPSGSRVAQVLVEQYEYDGLETCAADGMCRTTCPLAIDTGALVKELRADAHGERAQRTAAKVAERFGTVERAARGGLQAGEAAARVVGDGAVAGAARLARGALGDDLVPSWPSSMPAPAAPSPPRTVRTGAAAVYLPACLNRIFGMPRGAGGEGDPLAGLLPLQDALVAISSRAGAPLWIPDDVEGVCCGTPWSSKGYTRGKEVMGERVRAALRRWSGDGALPVVIDASSCAHTLLGDDALDGVEVVDAVAWLHDRLLPSLTVTQPLARVAVHPTCSTRHMGLDGKLGALAAQVGADVVVPLSTTCCGMAGDRGLLHPELTAAATAPMAAELAAEPACDAHVSSNRTCELGMQEGTGHPYVSIVQLLERATR